MATTDEPIQTTPPRSAASASAGMKADLTDHSQFIRTMAKDMAALAGTPAVKPAPKKEKQAKQQETVSGVTLDKTEHPFFEKTRPASEDRAPEALALPTMKEAGAIVGPAAPTATPAALEAERAAVLERLRQKVGDSAQMSIQQSPAPVAAAASPVKDPAQAVPAPLPVAATAPHTEPAARSSLPVTAPASALPAVTETHSEQEPVQAPRPEPIAPAVAMPAPVAEPAPAETPAATPSPAWPDMPAPAPVFASIAEPAPARMPPIGKETYREPIEEPVPLRSVAPAQGDNMHTYTSDFADRIRSKQSSAFSVLAAEQDARPVTPPALSVRKGPPSKAVIMVATGILLLVIAGGGVFGIYQFVMTMRDTPIASLTVPTIVFADEYRELEGTGSALLQSLANASNGALVPGNVLAAYVLTSANGEDGGLITAPAGGDAFMRLLQIPAPDILLRNIAAESTVGAVHADGTHPFFALRVDSYERTYAGMLTWEPLMQRDLGILFPLYRVADETPEPQSLDVMASSTATSTAVSTTTAYVPEAQAVARTRFEDAIVANHDVRVLRDTQGRALILYGYADKRTLLIVRDEAAFETLLARLKAE